MVGASRLGSRPIMSFNCCSGMFIVGLPCVRAGSPQEQQVEVLHLLPLGGVGLPGTWLLAMNWVLLWKSSWMILRPWALMVLSVSVTSTMASASPAATLASVAPQEFSTGTGIARS